MWNHPCFGQSFAYQKLILKILIAIIIYTSKFNCSLGSSLVEDMITSIGLCGLEDQNSANICHCVCHKRWLIIRYKLFYTTGLLYAGLLYAWSSFMQWGLWVWTVGHLVVLVQVIFYFKDRLVLLYLRTNGIPERRSWVTATVLSPIAHSSPFSMWLNILLFFFPAKTMLSGQVYGFCTITLPWHLPLSYFVYCIVNMN